MLYFLVVGISLFVGGVYELDRFDNVGVANLPHVEQHLGSLHNEVLRIIMAPSVVQIGGPIRICLVLWMTTMGSSPLRYGWR